MVTLDEIVDPSNIQLGFAEPVQDYPIGHESPAWSNWDGGQIGGKPSWLNPRDLPNSPLLCRNCQTGLRFICQLYAPADHLTPNAYHRSFYIFACPACPVRNQNQQTGFPEGSVRVLRTQLHAENEFYPETEDTPSQDWNKHLSSTYDVELCQVCGQRGTGKCPIQCVSFCGRDHQKEYKKYVFQKQNPTSCLPSVFPKFELVVDDEPPPDDGVEEEREALMPTTDEKDPDLDLEQDDLDDATGNKYRTSQDPRTTDFYARVQRAQDQCLRYYPQWEQPTTTERELWIVSEPIPENVPPCPYCQSERKCEFQIMPQMLYHLLEEHRKVASQQLPIVSATAKHALSVAAEICETAPPQYVPPALKDCHDDTLIKIKKHLLESNEMDWGVIVVYTCTASCSSADIDPDLGAYREEYAWKQPPP